MSTIHPVITGCGVVGGQLEPMAVTPRQACTLLNVGNTRLYELIAAGELETYHEGRARRITMGSIRNRIARLLAAATSADAKTTSPRRCGPTPSDGASNR
jgi:excisionase family DNA binding protein